MPFLLLQAENREIKRRPMPIFFIVIDNEMTKGMLMTKIIQKHFELTFQGG
jgi:hypothetical protein